MSRQLEGKIAVITGAASGIGLASVRAFLAEGAKVVGGDLNDERGQQLQNELGPDFLYKHADVTVEGDIASLVDAAVAQFGKLDVMFNNAGGSGDPAAIVDLTIEGYERTSALISRAVVLGHKYAARRFIEQKSGGSIISTSSLAGVEGGWTAVSYNMGKHAVIGLVKQATAELGRYGIRSNAIAPGIIPTAAMPAHFGVPRDRADEFLEYAISQIADQQPIGRAGRAEDIANAAVFFASDASNFISGQNLVVDGGITAVYQGNYHSLATKIASDFINNQQATAGGQQAGT